MTRRDQIIALALACFDYEYAPPLKSAEAKPNLALRGVAANAWQLCPGCDGEGSLKDRFKREHVCGQCGGLGRYKTDRNLEPAHQLPVGTAETKATTRMRSAVCDRCAGAGVWKQQRCGICDGSGRREWSTFELRVASEDASVDPIERHEEQLARHLASGSFRELELCLAVLRRLSGHRHDVFYAVYVSQTRRERSLTAKERTWVEEAISFLDSALPSNLRVPRYALEALGRRKAQTIAVKGRHADARVRAARDLEWQRLFVDEGVSVKDIAAMSGVSVDAVQRVVYAEDAA